jgi:Mg2+-importing ATPase
VFDYATFGILLRVLHAKEDEFRTGWFVESVVSACLVVLVVRTKNALWSSRPAVALAATTLAVAIGTIALPFTPLAARLGFTTLPVSFLVSMLAIVALYLATAEAAKRWFYRGERDVALQSRF